MNYVTEMFLRQLEDLRCTEGLFKEYCQKDHQDRFLNLKTFPAIRLKISNLKLSASKKGLAPRSKIGLSQPIKVPNHTKPKK